MEPPPELSYPPRGEATIVTRRVVDVAEQPGVDGALLCAWLLVEQGKGWPAATAILERRARAAGWRRDAVEKAAWAARQVSADEEQRIRKAALEARPDEWLEDPVNPAGGPP